MRVRGRRAVVGVAACGLLATGCGSGTPSTAPPPGATAPGGAVSTGPATTPASPVRPSPAGTPTAGPARWSTSPVTVVHEPAVPPVPVVTGVRTAGHPDEGYDRIVFDVRGTLPGYTVRYVSEVRADPSDRRIDVPGRRWLLVTFRPAQAHGDDGKGAVDARVAVDLPTLRGYALAGDFEGTVSIALGLDHVAGFRVGELSGRIYVDVAR